MQLDEKDAISMGYFGILDKRVVNMMNVTPLDLPAG